MCKQFHSPLTLVLSTIKRGQESGKIILACLLLCGALQAEDRIGMAVLAIPMSVRQQGMGNVGLGGDDIMKAWSNPALLADQGTQGEVALNGASMFGGEQTAGGVGAGWRAGSYLTMGALANYYTLSAPELDELGNTVGTSLSQDTASVGAVGAFRYRALRAGVTLKYVTESLVQDRTNGYAGDLGVALVVGPAIVAASVRNLGTKLRSDEALGISENLPTEYRAGAVMRFKGAGFSAGAEYVKPVRLDGSVGAGAEWWPAKYFAVRAGVAELGGKAGMQMTAGISARWSGITVDYALGTHSLGLNNRVCMSYAFGGPAQEPVYSEPSPSLAPVEKPLPEVAPQPKAREGVKNIAVADLAPQSVAAGDAAIISELLRSELVQQKGLNIVEKQEMDKILHEQAFQQSGCTSEECAVKLGKLLNVHMIATGIFGKLLDQYFIQVRIVDVETGKILFAESAKGRDVDEIEKSVKVLAVRIAGNLR